MIRGEQTLLEVSKAENKNFSTYYLKEKSQILQKNSNQTQAPCEKLANIFGMNRNRQGYKEWVERTNPSPKEPTFLQSKAEKLVSYSGRPPAAQKSSTKNTVSSPPQYCFILTIRLEGLRVRGRNLDPAETQLSLSVTPKDAILRHMFSQLKETSLQSHI